MKVYCVYKHITPNGKVYIGVTCQKAEKRWNGGRGYANNRHFHNAIEKYGWSNIKHEIIASGLTKQEASEAERYYIDLHKSNDPKHGYNHTSGGYDGYELTQEQLDNMSKRSKIRFGDKDFKKKFDEKMKSPERRQKISEGLANYYKSPEAKRKASEIQKAKWGKDGYREKMKAIAEKRGANPRYREKLSRVLTEIRSSDEYKASMTGGNNPHARSIYQFSLNGTLIKKFASVADASRAVGGNHANIIYCAIGKTKSSYGYIWSYSERIGDKADKIKNYVSPKAIPIIQYDLKGNLVREYNSISEASRCLNASAGTIGMALNGKRKTAYKSVWRYKEKGAEI